MEDLIQLEKDLHDAKDNLGKNAVFSDSLVEKYPQLRIRKVG